MDERIVRLRTHQKNIDRYQSLLKTQLSDAEMHDLEKRLSEERFAMAMLHFMMRSAVAGHAHPEALEYILRSRFAPKVIHRHL